MGKYGKFIVAMAFQALLRPWTIFLKIFPIDFDIDGPLADSPYMQPLKTEYLLHLEEIDLSIHLNLAWQYLEQVLEFHLKYL